MLTSYPADKASIYLNTGAEVAVTEVKVSSDEQHKIIAKTFSIMNDKHFTGGYHTHSNL